MNKVILVGRLTDTPTLEKYNDKCVSKFTLAINRPVVRDGVKVADFINCVVWNSQAENLCKYQSKGNLLGVFGEIRKESFEVNNEKKTKTFVLVSSIEFLESKKEMSKEEENEFEQISYTTEMQNPFAYTDEELPWRD